MNLKALIGAPYNAPDEAGGNTLQINPHALGMPVAQLMHQQQRCPTSGQQGIRNYPVQLP